MFEFLPVDQANLILLRPSLSKLIGIRWSSFKLKLHALSNKPSSWIRRRDSISRCKMQWTPLDKSILASPKEATTRALIAPLVIQGIRYNSIMSMAWICTIGSLLPSQQVLIVMQLTTTRHSSKTIMLSPMIITDTVGKRRKRKVVESMAQLDNSDSWKNIRPGSLHRACMAVLQMLGRYPPCDSK